MNDNQARQAIMLQSQYIKDMSMEIPHAPVIFKKLRENNPNVDIKVNVEAQKLEEENTYNVVLNFAINGDIKEEKAFILELSYGAVVSLNIPDEHKEPVLMIEIPHLIYPYARQIISNTMSNAGLPPLMLNPIDFLAMYNAKKAKEQALKEKDKKKN